MRWSSRKHRQIAVALGILAVAALAACGDPPSAPKKKLVTIRGPVLLDSTGTCRSGWVLVGGVCQPPT